MKVAVIGAGNMGMAFSNAFVKNGLVRAKDILLIEARNDTHSALKEQGFSWIADSIDKQITECSIVILAVKPQDFKVMASVLKTYLTEKHILLSIMAGISIAGMSANLDHTKIVRSMPNTPAKLGAGITGYYIQGLNAEEKNIIRSLIESTGTAVEVDKELLLNAVTALSGSGPAYFYYFLRAMVGAGKQLGLPEDLAHKLACETMNGSYHLIKESGSSFDDLIKAVTSKGGTTEAALRVFENHHLSEVIQDGILRAEARAKELSESN